MTLQNKVPVLLAPMVAQQSNRIRMELPDGLTLAQIVALAMPDAGDHTLSLVRVTLVSPQGQMATIRKSIWHRVRPHAGTQVIIRIVPGKSVVRSVLSIVISIAAVALGALWGPILGGALGISTGMASAIIGLGVTVLGNMLLNALIPPPSSKANSNNKGDATYSITGWRNEARPNGVIPFVLGKHRYAPPYAASPYSEIVGDKHYIRALFICGYGPNYLEDLRIGETSIAEYTNISVEQRSGWSNDGPVTIYPKQVFEEPINVELTRPLPRNSQGDVTSGAARDTPVKRATGLDAAQASAIFSFPGGLIKYNDEGKAQSVTVQIRIRQRLAGTEAWQTVGTYPFTNKKAEGFFRQVTWTLPSRGRWEIEFDRMTDEHVSSQVQSRSVLAALQTIRPEYPINMSQKLSLVAVRVQATYQLQGTLDSFNLMVRCFCWDYDVATSSWIQRHTENPASLLRYVLQSGAYARPVANTGIDFANFVEFHNFCRIKGLKYDRVIDTEMTLDEVTKEIAAAGRARPRHDGTRWGVVMDKPQELVVHHLSPRNSHSFKANRVYSRKPHAFRVPFVDATNDYQPSERIVRWPGYTGEITLTEQLEMPGKTDPNEIWIEARRRMYEAIHRPDTYTLVQDGPISPATRGDLVMGSFDVLSSTQRAARVKAVEGTIIQLDDIVEMSAGESYGLRWRMFTAADDTIGISVLHRVVTIAGRTDVLMLADTEDRPTEGDIVHFGLMASESMPLIVSGVEAGEDFSSHFRLIDAAPIIDQLTDAEVAPAWNGRVGGEIDPPTTKPSVPEWVSIETGFSGTGSANGFIVTLAPGTASTTVTQLLRIEHRLFGATSWTTVTIAAGAGGAPITGYVRDDTVQLRAFAIAAGGIESDPTAIVTTIVGSGDGPIPEQLDIGAITITALLGGVRLTFETTDDSATTAIQFHRSTTPNFMDAVPAGASIPVEPSRSYSHIDGDGTRTNLISNGDFAYSAPWLYGTGWAWSSGVARHTAGATGSLVQNITLAAEKAYRIAYTVTGRTAGSVTPRLNGGTDVVGVACTANGDFSDRLVAVTGNTNVRFIASADFDGAIDNVVVFLETTTSLDAGTHFYWLSPLNSDGVPGNAVGSFSATIR